jgi:hypothetical protein
MSPVAAANIIPSEDMAIDEHSPNGSPVVAHDAPEFVEVQMQPPETGDNAAAANTVPSAEEATETQRPIGALVLVQLAPELVEVKIGP